jgi:hypothetical protein
MDKGNVTTEPVLVMKGLTSVVTVLVTFAIWIVLMLVTVMTAPVSVPHTEPVLDVRSKYVHTIVMHTVYVVAMASASAKQVGKVMVVPNDGSLKTTVYFTRMEPFRVTKDGLATLVNSQM